MTDTGADVAINGPASASIEVPLETRVLEMITKGGRSWSASEILAVIKTFEPDTTIETDDVVDILDNLCDNHEIVVEVRYSAKNKVISGGTTTAKIQGVITTLQSLIEDISHQDSTVDTTDPTDTAGTEEQPKVVGVPSETTMGVVYYVNLTTCKCTCPDYIHRSTTNVNHVCKHMRTIVQNPVGFNLNLTDIVPIATMIALGQ